MNKSSAISTMTSSVTIEPCITSTSTRRIQWRRITWTANAHLSWAAVIAKPESRRLRRKLWGSWDAQISIKSNNLGSQGQVSMLPLADTTHSIVINPEMKGSSSNEVHNKLLFNSLSNLFLIVILSVCSGIVNNQILFSAEIDLKGCSRILITILIRRSTYSQ